MKDYLDFELRVSPGTDLDYPVSVIRSPAGEARGTMRFPYDASALERQLLGLENAILKSGSLRRDIRASAPETESVTAFGTHLFQALFSEEVQTALRRSQDRARAEKKGLRVRMRIEAPELSSLPWEFMYDPSEGDFVCLSSETPIVRYLEFDRPLEELSVEPPISILAVCASPSDRPGLDVAKERGRIEKATEEMRRDGTLTLTWQENTTYRELQRALRKGTYHILHFVGHGGFDSVADEGMLALTNDEGGTALTSATDLARLLADHPTLRLVVLNSCLGARGSTTNVFSSTAAALVRRGVPAVVAMQYEISDLAAIEFSRSLYEAIADGLPIDAAVSEARKMVVVTARNSVEWGTPVLHMRSPDGVLFKVDTSKTGTHARRRMTMEQVRRIREEPTPPAAPLAAVPLMAAPAPPTPSQAPAVAPAAAMSAAPENSPAPKPLYRRPLVLAAAAAIVLAISYGLISGGSSGGTEPDGTELVAESDSTAGPEAQRPRTGTEGDGSERVSAAAGTPDESVENEPTTEELVAEAYLQAISGGQGETKVNGVVDYGERGCDPSKVWDAPCQGAVLDGKDGKTLFMESITPIAANADWHDSNIEILLPEADMRRIMSDPGEGKARDLFGYMSDPNNDWFPEHGGAGGAKSILRRYMRAMQP